MDGSQTPRESFEEMKKLYDEMVELKKGMLELVVQIHEFFETWIKIHKSL